MRPINLKEGKAIEKLFIEKTEKKLEEIKIKQKELKRTYAPKEAIEKLQKRYGEIKKSLDEYKENPITEKDL